MFATAAHRLAASPALHLLDPTHPSLVDARSGRRGIYGDLDRLASAPYTDKAKVGSASAITRRLGTRCLCSRARWHRTRPPSSDLQAPNMQGIGFTPEATEMIPSQFDVVMEAGWRTAPVDPEAWLQAWAVRRYGAPNSPSIARAHSILRTAAYNSPIDTASLESYPSIADGMSHNTNATGLLEALRLYVAAARGGELDPGTGTFSYDLTDLHRQVGCVYLCVFACMCVRVPRGPGVRSMDAGGTPCG